MRSSAASPIASIARTPVSTGGWWRASSVGRLGLLAERLIEPLELLLAERAVLATGTGAVAAHHPQRPAAHREAHACSRPAPLTTEYERRMRSRSSWLPGIACTGTPSGATARVPPDRRRLRARRRDRRSAAPRLPAARAQHGSHGMLEASRWPVMVLSCAQMQVAAAERLSTAPGPPLSGSRAERADSMRLTPWMNALRSSSGSPASMSGITRSISPKIAAAACAPARRPGSSAGRRRRSRDGGSGRG